MPHPQEVFDNPSAYWPFLTAPSDDQFEGQHFDRKQAGSVDSNGRLSISTAQFNGLKQEILETTSAFANSHAIGGLLIIGISSNGEAGGIAHLSEEQKNALTNINGLVLHHAARARIYEHPSENRDSIQICLIYSAPTQSGICETPGNFPKAWLRAGCQNVAIDQLKRDQLRRDKRFLNFEMMPCCPYDPEDVDQEVVSEFRKVYVASSGFNEWTQEKLLYQAGAIVRDKNGYQFTNAGLLFFSANPQRVLSHSYCRLLRFECLYSEQKQPQTASFDRTFSGPLTKQIRQLRTFLKESAFFKTLQIRRPDGGFRDDPEFPFVAIDEAIVNAVAHRDYAAEFATQLLGYRDAFVVNNSGTVLQRETDVPTEFSLSEVALVSTPRNSKIIEWLRLMKDEHGAEFVRALSEGTLRIRQEMEQAGLPIPVFRISPWQTRLILLNNWEEREGLLLQQVENEKPEIANLFPVKIGGVGGSSIRQIDVRALRQEFSSALKDSLEANGWFIDNYQFNRLVAHRQGVDLPILQAAKPIVRFYRGYTFQLREYNQKVFLTIDYSLQVRNVLSARLLIQNNPWVRLIGRTAIADFQGWQRCKIISADVEFTKVYMFDFQTEETVPSNRVIPTLDRKTLQTLLDECKVRFDLDKEIKKYSLLSDAHASRTRWDLIQRTADDVSKNIFPLRVRQLKFALSSSPEALSRGATATGLVVKSIDEPKVEFNHKHETTDVRDGITRFGAYDSDVHEVEIVPVCLAPFRDNFANLIERLKAGKYKYRGAERTFSTRFHYGSITTCLKDSDLEDHCKRMLQEHPNWVGNEKLNRIFLVQTPESAYSIDDESAPYYRVKRLLLENGIPCQMVDTDTILNADWKDLNLSLNITAKCGVSPWVLPGAIPDADFFVGLSYTQSRKENATRLLGHANVFNNYGRWQFFSANTKTVPFEERTAHFGELVSSTLKQLTLSDTPSIYFHSSVKFSRADRSAILAAARAIRPNGTYHFVWINAHHNLRCFDLRPETDGSLGRGCYVITGPNQIYLSTTGHNPFRKLLGTPVLLELNAYVEGPRDQAYKPDLHALAAQILSLTKLNWASTDSLCGEPITTKYAGDIAYLTAAFLRRNGTFQLHRVLEKTPWFI